MVRVLYGVFTGWCVVHVTLTPVAGAALESGVYYTVPGATVEEFGDRVAGGRRVVPMSAILTFDLDDGSSSLTAVIPNAVFEGGEPFELTVRSASAHRLPDGSYRFDGTYIPTPGLYYGFTWTFSTATDGSLRWNGSAGCACGHIWHVAISNVVIAPPPRLGITQVGNMLEITWHEDETRNYALEETDSLPLSAGAIGWTSTAGVPRIENGRRVLTVPQTPRHKFYRLRASL